MAEHADAAELSEASSEDDTPPTAAETVPEDAPTKERLPNTRHLMVAGCALVLVLGGLVGWLGVQAHHVDKTKQDLDADGAPVVEAASLKYLGTEFESAVIEFARRVGFPVLAEDSLSQALMASPGFSLRGGASDVLLSIVSRQSHI